MRKVTLFPSALSLAVLLAMSHPAWSQASASGSGNTALYDTFELTFNAPGVGGNKFRSFASVIFSKGGRTFQADGFHDGGDTWRTRFMPDQTGTWSYSWSFNGSTGSGTFTCTSRTNPDNHGHVKRDPARPRYLIYDDGEPHHWFGGKWIAASHYGPSSKGGVTNPRRRTDAELTSYLDICRQNRHNGLLIKTSLYPLENDKFSWDLSWIRRGEWLVREMAQRGIYCQVNFFDTWSRDRNKWFEYNTSGGSQPFNVWTSGDETAKENYIRYVVARYAGFANVYWELGNEMEHSPNSGSAFVSQADSKYLPWIRQYDPYGLPIGLSEGIWTSANVDIGYLHQTDRLPAVNTNGNRPNIMNELVRGCGAGALWRDTTIRNGAARLCYRRTFWRMFTYGGTGSSEATWLQIDTPLNSAVLNVMADHKRLRDFLDTISVHWNDMDTDTGFVTSGPGSSRTRRKTGEAYVVYFLGSSGGGSVSVSLPPGTYEARWYHPSSGQWETLTAVTSTGGGTNISHPSFSEDLALRILSTSTPPVPPPADPQSLTASAASASRIDLSWTDASSDEDGFRIERKTGTSGSYSGIGTVSPGTTGYSDTGLASSTLYVYRVRAYNSGGNSGYTNEAGATTSSATGGLVSNTFPSAYTWAVLSAGTMMYIDRTYTFNAPVPAALDGEVVLQTANNDKMSSTSVPNFVSFTVNQDATVYVLYTNVNTTLEADWLNGANGWTPEAFTVPTSLPAGESARLVQSKFFASGSAVTLPGNGATSGTSSMYNIVVVPSTGGGPADSDGDGLTDADEVGIYGTNPQVADTDGDGMQDGDEVAYGLDPLDADQDQNSVPDGQDDWNGNLASNQADIAAGLSPGLPPVPGPGPSGSSRSGGSDGCGTTGAEALLLLALFALRRRLRA